MICSLVAPPLLQHLSSLVERVVQTASLTPAATSESDSQIHHHSWSRLQEISDLIVTAPVISVRSPVNGMRFMSIIFIRRVQEHRDTGKNLQIPELYQRRL